MVINLIKVSLVKLYLPVCSEFCCPSSSMVAAASVVDLSSDEVTSATYSVEVTTVAAGAVAGAFSSAVAALALGSSVSGSVEVTSGAKPELDVTGPSTVSLSDSILDGGGGDLEQEQTCLI